MSRQQDQPPPLPPRSPAPPGAPVAGRDQRQARPEPAVLGSFRDSWRQIKSSLGSEPQQPSYNLKAPPLPPRPVSPSAASREYEQPTPDTTDEAGRHGLHHQSDGITDDIDELLKELTVSSEARACQEKQTSSAEPSRGMEQGAASTPALDPLPPSYTAEPSDPSPSDKPTQPDTCCISAAMTFPTTWCFHPNAPEVPICSRCYDEHLRNTKFSGNFAGRHIDDNIPRACKFSMTRIQERLLKQAEATGSLDALVNYMKFRTKIPDCKGLGGVKGSEGTKWYLARDDAIPGLVICEACWEDHASVYSFASRFQQNTTPQGEDDIWACDLSVPYVRKEYEKRSRAGDWPGFVTEASARLQIAPCPKTERAPRNSRKWFCPKEYPLVLICPACFCDHVLGTGEEGKWRDSDEDQTVEYADKCLCVLGLFSMAISMSFAQDRKDYSLFWNALDQAVKGPSCEPEGIKGAVWYTLKSDPKDFGVCGGCYISIIQSMDMTKFFVRKTGIQPDATHRCCLNPEFPRFPVYLQRLLESYYTQSTATLESFAADYAQLPLCRRAKTLQNGIWYGWLECTICPACHHEFTRGTALEASMPLKAALRKGHNMCQMYSPRMRALYREACAASPPDPTALIAFGDHRTEVYVQTVMVIEKIMTQQRMALYRQQSLNSSSLFYTWLGNAEARTIGATGSWGAAGVGYGFENQNQLQGAMYGKQARDVGSQVSSGTAVWQIGELERQWRAVE